MITSDLANKEILSVKELARFLSLGESTIRRLIREQRIPYNKIEGRYLFFVPLIREWLMKTSVQPVICQENDVTQITETIWERAKGEK